LVDDGGLWFGADESAAVEHAVSDAVQMPTTLVAASYSGVSGRIRAS
jgi:hypothetical protein